jgi:phage terminase small subunit
MKTKIDYDINDLMDFLNEDVTKSKAQEYIDLMSDLQKVIDKQRVNKATKEAASKVFNAIVMKVVRVNVEVKCWLN